MLGDENARVIDRIGSALDRVVGDDQSGGARRAHGSAFGVLQDQSGELGAFRVVIFVDQDLEGLLSLTRRKDQPSGHQHVIAFLLGGIVFAGNLDRRALVVGPEP